MKRPAIVLLLMLGVLVGCGPAVRYVYSKPGATEAQRKRDESECERQSMVTISAGYAGASYERFDRDLFNRCMAKRGYEMQEKKD